MMLFLIVQSIVRRIVCECILWSFPNLAGLPALTTEWTRLAGGVRI